MEVLLLKDVKGMGRRMEVKHVKEGYARNFLFPQKIAVPFGSAAKELIAQVKAETENFSSKIGAFKKQLETEVFEFVLKSGVHGELFGSVKAEDIGRVFKEKGFGDAKIHLEKPIRARGEHVVEVDFGRGIRATAKIRIKG